MIQTVCFLTDLLDSRFSLTTSHVNGPDTPVAEGRGVCPHLDSQASVSLASSRKDRGASATWGYLITTRTSPHAPQPGIPRARPQTAFLLAWRHVALTPRHQRFRLPCGGGGGHPPTRASQPPVPDEATVTPTAPPWGPDSVQGNLGRGGRKRWSTRPGLPFRGPSCPRVSKHGSWRVCSARAPADLLGSEERVKAATALASGSQIPVRGGDGGEGAPLIHGAAAPPGPTSRRCLCQQCDGGPCRMDGEGAVNGVPQSCSAWRGPPAGGAGAGGGGGGPWGGPSIPVTGAVYLPGPPGNGAPPAGPCRPLPQLQPGPHCLPGPWG